LFLSIPTDIANIDTTIIGTPVGWGDPAGGLLFFGPDVNPSTSFIEWSANAGGLVDVQIGSSLDGFSFMASQASVGPITFALDGSNTLGTAQEVTATPEPASFGLMLFMFAILFIKKTERPAVVASGAVCFHRDLK
jgi:hypothetical protein